MIWLLLAACGEESAYQSIFDAPTASDVIYPEEGTLLDEPLGFVASSRSGVVTALDLKHETALSDQVAAPFLRPRGIALGAGRQVGELRAYATEEGAITLHATDIRNRQLVEAPYILGYDPYPVLPSPAYSLVESPDSVSIEEVELKTGHTTTETWSFVFDGDLWEARGSRSGLQETRAEMGAPYTSDGEELVLTIDGEAEEGAEIVLSTSTSVMEFPLQGVPVGLEEIAETSLLIVAVYEPETQEGWLNLFDRDTRQELGRLEVPGGGQPWSMEWWDQTLIVTDANSPRILRLQPNLEAWEESQWTEEVAPAVMHDLAVVTEEGYDHLFVSAAEESRIDLLDLRTGEWKDINPFDSQNLGMALHSPVVGISASLSPVDLQTSASWGAEDRDKVVVATTFQGRIVMLEGSTGCLATAKGGAYVTEVSVYSDETVSFNDYGPSSNPTMLSEEATGQSIVTSSCGGVLLSEEWTIRYDGLKGDWSIEGSITGKQEKRASMDERYLSDKGELSFTIVSGTRPPTDGDSFYFATSSNVLEIEQLLNTSGGIEAVTLPAAPLAFDYDAGPSDGGWNEYRGRSFALIPITNSDIVVRLRLETWSVEAVWN
jgi:hypothetical protein